MKFFAILRDSLREALDAKIIYFLFGLSVLVMLLAASISFKAEPGEKGLEAIIQRIPGGSGGFGNGPISYSIENFQQTNDTPHAYKGEYRYDLVVTENVQGDGEAKDGDEDKAGPKKAPQKQPSAFKTMVVMLPLATTKDEELTESQREIKAELGGAMMVIARHGGKVSKGQLSKLEERLTREIASVTPAQMEQFIQKQLSGAGALEATKVSLAENKEHSFRFQVECKARPDTVRTWPHELVFFFGALTFPVKIGVGQVVYFIENYLVAGIGAGLAMLLATIITAFFIPNMLRKGTVDLLISKPIHRWSLLLSKYVGGLTFMFLNTVVIVAGIWVVLGLRSGLWGTGFLLSILVLTFQFAIFYAFSTLIAVLTRSPIVCILSSIALWALLWVLSLVLSIMKPFHEFKQIPDWAYNSTDMARRVLPRYKDLDTINAELIADDLLAKGSPDRLQVRKDFDAVHWSESLAVTIGYITVLLGLACWRFSVKDY
jgi:ABC-type transport system involved in multi-copper enzyme maturation permease subunit